MRPWLRLPALGLVALAGSCSIVSRTVPCDDPGDCPSPLVCDVANGRCIAEGEGEGEGEGCGNGVVEGAEVCDDGNTDNEDGCTTLCAAPSCDDGLVTGTEECDDGNDDDTDACLASCLAARCGDLVVQLGREECDPPGPACSGNCEFLRPVLQIVPTNDCGGLVLINGEVAEDGTTVPDAGLVEVVPDVGCLGRLDSCLIATGCEVVFTPPTDAEVQLILLTGTAPIRPRTAAAAAPGQVLVGGDRDGPIEGTGLGDPTTTNGFVVLINVAEGTFDGADIPVTGGVSSVSQVGFDGVNVLVAGTHSAAGSVVASPCTFADAPGAFFAALQGQGCTGTSRALPLGIDLAVTGLVPLSGGAHLAINAPAGLELNGVPSEPGATIVTLDLFNDPLVFPLADVAIDALAPLGDGLVLAGRTLAPDVAVCDAEVTPGTPFFAVFDPVARRCDGVVAVSFDASTADNAINVRRMAVLDDRVLVVGDVRGGLGAGGGVIPGATTEGFILDMTRSGSRLEVAGLHAVTGDGAQQVVDVVMEERGVSILVNSQGPATGFGEEQPITDGLAVVFLSPALGFRRAATVPGQPENDTGVALVRGVGSQIHAVGQRGIDAFVATFGQP